MQLKLKQPCTEFYVGAWRYSLFAWRVLQHVGSARSTPAHLKRFNHELNASIMK